MFLSKKKLIWSKNLSYLSVRSLPRHLGVMGSMSLSKKKFGKKKIFGQFVTSRQSMFLSKKKKIWKKLRFLRSLPITSRHVPSLPVTSRQRKNGIDRQSVPGKKLWSLPVSHLVCILSLPILTSPIPTRMGYAPGHPRVGEGGNPVTFGHIPSLTRPDLTRPDLTRPAFTQ